MPGQSFRGFAERVALVTDGARGVGRAVALQLAFAGAYVINGYRPGDTEGERVARERSEEHTSELQSCQYLVCRLLLEKKKHSGAAPPPPPSSRARRACSRPPPPSRRPPASTGRISSRRAGAPTADRQNTHTNDSQAKK